MVDNRDPAKSSATGARQATKEGVVRYVLAVSLVLVIVGFIVAAVDATIPAFIGRVVNLLSITTPADLFRDHWHQLLLMGCVLSIVRPATH